MVGTAEVSHGRGGAGNINPDDTKYVDGEVTRTGVEGSHHDGAFSTGRGGAANIGDAHTKAAARADHDVIPEAAVRPSHEGDFHTGRGGAGNEHHAKTPVDKDHPPKGLADQLKHKILGIFKK